MKSLRCSTTIRLLTILTIISTAATCWAQQSSPIAEKIAKAYGLDSYGQIDAMRYTFNVEIPALKLKLAHSWTFEPKTNQVTFESTDKDGKPVKVTYKRTELSSQPDNVKNEVDPAFINDSYWFMLPFHVYWDTGATVTDEGTKKLPLGAGSADKVVVKYPAEAGGYTPGDTWDLYIDKENRIVAMVYHRGGPKKPSVVTVTWAGYKKAGPLLVSTEHKGTADGGALHLWFSNVAVKMAGSDTWMDAK
jgi:hypothetical protein